MNFFYFILSVALALSFQPSVAAAEGGGLKNHLSVGMGWELLKYEEHEPDMDLNASAKAGNVVIRLEGLKKWESLFGGIKAVIPVALKAGDEVWTSSGKRFQTNTLKYRWVRMDGFLGYPFNDLVNPYVGLRWSESEQKRKDFIENNTMVFGTAREKVTSWSALGGVRGRVKVTPQWKWNYSLEYYTPISVNIENSAIPGFESSDRDGYALELKLGVGYCYKQTLSFTFLVYGGRMHWSGSGWKPSPGGLTKWPGNDTDYLGGAVCISWGY